MTRLMVVAIASTLSLVNMDAGAETNCARELGAASTRTEVFDCMVDLLEEIDALHSEIEVVREQRWPTIGGAVIASTIACDELPGDWEPYRPAIGRFVVGAGNADLEPFNVWQPSHRRRDGSTPPPQEIRTYNPLDYGGEENVTLMEQQMPYHDHEFPEHGGHAHSYWYFNSDAGNTYAQPGDSNSPISFSQSNTVDPDGADQPHNNMPPYIALYWCTPTSGDSQ